MAVKHFNLPDPGEGLVEAEVVTWKVKVGDTVKVNDSSSRSRRPSPWSSSRYRMPARSLRCSRPRETRWRSAPRSSLSTTASAGTTPRWRPLLRQPRTTTRSRQARSAALLPVAGSRCWSVTARGRPRPSAAPARVRGAPAVATAQVNQAFAPVPEPVVSEPVEPEPVEPEPVVAQPASMPVAGSGRALAKPPVRKLAKDLGIDISQVAGSGEGGHRHPRRRRGTRGRWRHPGDRGGSHRAQRRRLRGVPGTCVHDHRRA
jgi:pyruvate dehydrogenase E2 component (dihydrolipoamide acetyltransferase)